MEFNVDWMINKLFGDEKEIIEEKENIREF
jgi:hypothetical protein